MTIYYSEGVYGGNGKVFRATSTSPPGFRSAGSVLNTSHYANDVKKFQVGSKSWYVMLLYIERGAAPVPDPVFSYSLSNDGVVFGAESPLFGGLLPEDHFATTPAFVTKDGSILGVDRVLVHPNGCLQTSSRIRMASVYRFHVSLHCAGMSLFSGFSAVLDGAVAHSSCARDSP